MREYSVPPAAAIVPTANITDYLVDALATDPDRVQFRRRADGGWRPVTLREFLDQARGAAKGLIASGVQLGDQVGLMSRTRYE